ncbi:CCA tRNA nucleotidyltransferase [Collinsella sp. zg1085]|uniref:CCA tRNA nucleotidyltransferase n=1 Tax=Collinsella sp. zg1085 TaxID=2844380 RepID=UPI001C0D6268|nr:CCA tRNA nucleotidyltransferase [Collinsella sp. zg1085]QWT17167.1 CCA tRNA nucleotidyltransferase [Collinsella sp. zg1085]
MNYDSAHLNNTKPSPAALAVLVALEATGLEAWLVGGWVRDALRGVPSHDIDICSSGTWQENKAALVEAGMTVLETGIAFGGITACAAGERFEITTYRLDGFYTDGRHPETVSFARTIQDDLARRDFTVNAMAWHPQRGILDVYGGMHDLNTGLIRAVGKPQKRFEEDALRILRALRFAARLNFAIETQTADALKVTAPLLDRIARERVGHELTGILDTRRASVTLLSYPEVWCAAIPELAPLMGFDQQSRYHDADVYEHTARVLAVTSEMPRASLSLLWAALLHDIEKPTCFSLDEQGQGHFYGHPEAGAITATRIMRRLCLPEQLIRNTQALVRYHDIPLQCARASLLGMLKRFADMHLDAPQLMDELFDIKCADALGKAPAYHNYVQEIEHMRIYTHELLEAGEAYSLATLELSGRDLLEADMEPGPQLGHALNRALELHMVDAVPNERASLLGALRQEALI